MLKCTFSIGIAEVILPIEYRLKNIEETEIAKKKYERNEYRSESKKSSVVGSLAHNFNKHRRDYANDMKKDNKNKRLGDSGVQIGRASCRERV